MADSRPQFERWWGSGVVFNLILAAGAVGTLYYTRMQALNSEATGQEALKKIQDEARVNFDKLEATLRATNDRLVALEKSGQLAQQGLAISALQDKLAQLETKYNTPEDTLKLRSIYDQLQDTRRTSQAGTPGKVAGIPPLDAGIFSGDFTTSIKKKSSFLEPDDKKSLHDLLDGIKTYPPPIYTPLNIPKFEWKPVVPPSPPTTAEKVVSFAKSYGFLIVIVLSLLFGNRRR